MPVDAFLALVGVAKLVVPVPVVPIVLGDVGRYFFRICRCCKAGGAGAVVVVLV